MAVSFNINLQNFLEVCQSELQMQAEDPSSATYVINASEDLLLCFYRILKLLDEPLKCSSMLHLLEQELYLLILYSPCGAYLKSLVMTSGTAG